MGNKYALTALVVGLVVFGGVAASACGSDASDATTAAQDGGTSGTSSSGSSGSSPDASGIVANFDASAPVVVDGHCGFNQTGTPLHVADNIDLCMPQTVCAPETCPPALGDCVNGKCVFKAGYNGVQTLPQAWSTEYCDLLQNGGCHGVTQVDYPEDNAAAISKASGLPICETDSTGPNCIGVAAAPPMIVGNSQVTNDPATGQPVKNWGLGLTEATGICYEVAGPGGKAIVALVDRCGGYCKCNGSGFQECGSCVNAPDLATNCVCVGNAPPAYSGCCGNNCGVPVVAECDWCANNNHPHFDLDNFTFAHVCGSAAGAGSCQLTELKPINCLTPKAWPPGSGGGSTGGGATCGANSFQCTAAADNQPMVPGTGCCCNFGLTPQADKSCR